MNAEQDRTEVGAKANGFCSRLEMFSVYFMLHLLLKLFSHVDAANTALQARTLSLQQASSVIEHLKTTIQYLRSSFDTFWSNIKEVANNLSIEGPVLPRKRRVPTRLESARGEQHTFSTAKYRCQYFEVFDNALAGLLERFNQESLHLLLQVEKFVIGEDSGEIVCQFYGSDVDSAVLTSQHDMMLDIVQARQTFSGMRNLQYIVSFFKADPTLCIMFPELFKLIRLVLTIPVTTCTSERSFSALCRLKTFLRSTMTQARLNSIAVLHIHGESVPADLVDVVNDIISRSAVRRNTFSLT
ncbi:UNVERIFIED_CONTAM: hypothetical protein FKN15_060683 [Acipenser sinensis]